MSERWLRCGAEVVTPDGIQTVSTRDVDGPLVWTEDEYGNTSMWSASALRPLEPVSYREHDRVVRERDRLRSELEALREWAAKRESDYDGAQCAHWPSAERLEPTRQYLEDVVARLNAILRDD